MKLIVSNHKMNLTLNEVQRYIQELETLHSEKNLLIFCPSFPYLSYFKGKNYSLGSQNVAEQAMGALTGEVSAEQLKSLGVSYTIIGHSERRNILKESPESIEKKISLCIENKIVPILCIGESLEDRDRKQEILKNEIDSAIRKGKRLEEFIIAYEPIWAIGTGIIPTTEEIDETLSFIKKYIKENYEIDCKTLYGGSVNPKNIESLNKIKTIDGYLIGGTSLKINELKQIIEVLEV